MSNTPEYALQKVLLHKSRQFGYQIPATPYGLIAFVPAHANLDNVAGVSDWIHTDGIYVWKDPKYKMTGKAAAAFLKAQLSLSAKRLPFRVDGHAFMQVIETGDQEYRLVLVDPGWVDPSARKVKVYTQQNDGFTYRDLLSNETFNGDTIEITIPAGGFRLLETN